MTSKEANKLFSKSYFYNETFGIFYHFTDSLEEFSKMMEWIGHDKPVSINGRCVIAENGGETRILIGLFNNDIPTLVHECIHASLFTLDYIGQKLDYDDELLPYLTQFIFIECEKKITRNKKCTR